MSWSIQQVARLSGVTARTLRYYGEIGLLTPARIGSNGYRYYDQEQLLRLQHILVLRALGLDLTTIGSVVDAEHDPLEALRRHHRRLLDDRGRIDRLITTVAATIDHLERGTDMPAENMFDGFQFGPDYLNQLEADRIERTGESDQPEIAEVKNKTSQWLSDDYDSYNAEGADVTKRLATLLGDGVRPDADETMAVLDEDMVLQRKLWTPDKDSYVALAHALDEPSELRSYYNSHDPHLAEYLRDAMLAYADRNLS